MTKEEKIKRDARRKIKEYTTETMQNVFIPKLHEFADKIKQTGIIPDTNEIEILSQEINREMYYYMFTRTIPHEMSDEFVKIDFMLLDREDKMNKNITEGEPPVNLHNIGIARVVSFLAICYDDCVKKLAEILDGEDEKILNKALLEADGVRVHMIKVSKKFS